MTQNESCIQQINLGFNEQEDRLLLKIGLTDQSEISVWISRRICKSIWNLLQSSQHALIPANPTSTVFLPVSPALSKKTLMENFAREVEANNKTLRTDFHPEYRLDRQEPSELPLLAVQCVIISSEHSLPQIELQCRNGQSVKMTLTQEFVHAMTSMMLLATRETGWDLVIHALNSQSISTLPQETLH